MKKRMTAIGLAVLLLCGLVLSGCQYGKSARLQAALDSGDLLAALELAGDGPSDVKTNLTGAITGTQFAAGSAGFCFITAENQVCQVLFGEEPRLVDGLENVTGICSSEDGLYVDAVMADGTFRTTNPVQPAEAYKFYPSAEMVGAGAGMLVDMAGRFDGLSGIAYMRSDYPLFGLAAYDDGSVLLITPLLDDEERTAAEETWENIRQVAKCGDDVVGLTGDGTIQCRPESPYRDVYETWTDLVAVYGGGTHIFALRKDGTVVSAGQDFWGEGDTTGWSEIVSVAAGRTFTLGLRKDGTVVATGANTYGQCSVENWENIVAVAVAETCSLGIDSEGYLWVSGSMDGTTYEGVRLEQLAGQFIGLDLAGSPGEG